VFHQPGICCVGHENAHIAQAVGGQATDPAYPLPVAIARVAARRMDAPNPRPAPLYIKSADAAPSRDAAPVILP
jgi:tRNA threonylcarbamoyladenosine biosynthesis protein TsaB